MHTLVTNTVQLDRTIASMGCMSIFCTFWEMFVSTLNNSWLGTKADRQKPTCVQQQPSLKYDVKKHCYNSHKTCWFHSWNIWFFVMQKIIKNNKLSTYTIRPNCLKHIHYQLSCLSKFECRYFDMSIQKYPSYHFIKLFDDTSNKPYKSWLVYLGNESFIDGCGGL